MKPKNMMPYVPRMNTIADELISNIEYFASLNKCGEMPEDFHNELNKWALESVAIVAINKKLGCLNRNLEKNSDAQKLIEASKDMFELMYKLDVLPSLWKYMNTKNWKKLIRVSDVVSE